MNSTRNILMEFIPRMQKSVLGMHTRSFSFVPKPVVNVNNKAPAEVPESLKVNSNIQPSVLKTCTCDLLEIRILQLELKLASLEATFCNRPPVLPMSDCPTPELPATPNVELSETPITSITSSANSADSADSAEEVIGHARRKGVRVAREHEVIRRLRGGAQGDRQESHELRVGELARPFRDVRRNGVRRAA